MMALTLGTLALIKSFQLRVVLGGTKSGLEEGGAQGFHSAFAHFGLGFPLAAFLESRVVAHEGLEPGSDFAVRAGVEDLAGQVSQDLDRGSGAEARHRFDQRFGVWIERFASERFDLLIKMAQTRFHRAEGLEDGL